MSHRTAYDTWHQRIYEADPSHEDASSPWYQVVREYLGEVAGLCVLEVACGRGGFIRQMANAGARVTGAISLLRRCVQPGPNSSLQTVRRLLRSFRETPRTCPLLTGPSTLWFP